MCFNPSQNLVGGFSPLDGTIDFYLRVNSLLKSSDIVMDLGAGRAAWFEDDRSMTRKNIRLLRGKVSGVIAVDIDEAVFENKASDEQLLLKRGALSADIEPVDIIVADYVLEHVEDPEDFVKFVDLNLKSGGWFCARTPHKYHYVSLMARLISNASHTRILKLAQPLRKPEDVFPTAYKLNTAAALDDSFREWGSYTYTRRTEPSYYFGNKTVFQVMSFLQNLMPRQLSSNIMVFLQKP